MKRTLLTVLVLCVLPLFGGSELIYLIQSEHATLTPHENENRYATLVLKKVGKSLAYFSDDAHGGTMTMEDFMVNWQQASTRFHPVPPRSSLLDQEGQKHRIELRNPEYDPRTNTVIGEVFLIDQKPFRNPAAVTLIIERGAF